jgi:capsular exopolysaccharide synthesis family protein
MKTLDRLNADWLLAAEIHKLEARLWRKARGERIQVILITSPGRREGKTTTVALLATALALHPDRKIVAVDLDFREPRLNAHFDLEVPCGIGAVLRNECSLENSILKTQLPNLDLVLPSPDGEDPGLLLRTVDVEKTFRQLRESYDLILMDVPALLPVADASALLPFADGVILMAMAGYTTKPLLSRAREICVGMEANILGLIVGNLREAMPESAGGEYYYYRHTHRDSESGGDNGDPRAQG